MSEKTGFWRQRICIVFFCLSKIISITHSLVIKDGLGKEIYKSFIYVFSEPILDGAFFTAAINDNQKVMRVHVSEDKSFKVSAKNKRHSIIGNRRANILHVAASFGGAYRKKRNVGPDWQLANQTRGLIIHDSKRKQISVIVSLYIFLHWRLSLYDFDTYEMNSLTACLNSFLFLKCSFFGSLSVISNSETLFFVVNDCYLGN